MKIQLTKQFAFEMAHSLKDYDGLCRNIHGHSYKMDITITGEPLADTTSPKQGMIIDFGELKTIVNQQIISHFDHTLVLNAQVDTQLVQQLRRTYNRVTTVPYQPTTENLLLDFVERLRPALPKNVQLVSIRLHETDTSFAEIFC